MIGYELREMAKWMMDADLISLSFLHSSFSLPTAYIAMRVVSSGVFSRCGEPARLGNTLFKESEPTLHTLLSGSGNILPETSRIDF